MKLSPGIELVPYLHGRAEFATHIRRLAGERKYDCIAIDIPPCFEPYLGDGVDALPHISVLTALGESEPVYYLPVDPCDAGIEAIRQARQNHIPFRCIADSELYEPYQLQVLPDQYAITRLGFESFSTLCAHATEEVKDDPREDRTAQHIASRMRELRTEFSAMLVLVHFSRYTAVVRRFGQERSYNFTPESSPDYMVSAHYINPDHLYFALGELPFLVGLYEKERMDLFAPPVDRLEAVKDLFRHTRDNYFDDKQNITELSPVRLQSGLTFLRNLTISESRFEPSLFDIVAAAKGIGGNSFAVRILKSAKYYPYLPLEHPGGSVSVGIERISLPDGAGPRRAINLFRDTRLTWQTLKIRPDPTELQKKKYRFAWNPFGMCSHLPEDRRIESFNAYLKTKAQKVMREDYVKTEKFTTSVKDGIDIRETLRNWHTGGIYVKEIPPGREALDTVVIIFDGDHDEKYPNRATWYAEHKQESTLTFYATDPFSNMIGPGIARSFYGGLSLLFPPRPIPNAFELAQSTNLVKLSHQLVWGALMFSTEPAVAYVSAKRPDLKLRVMAQKFKKRLVWLPLSSFSNETIRKLRRFHVLNGKEVRSWATRFIGE